MVDIMIDLKLLRTMASNYTVLYVEDDLEIQHEMLNYMSKFFQKVVKADDGLAGLKAYQKESFDLVITDLSMPKMNGLEMLEKIRAINKEQLVLITSAHSESEYMIKAIKIGIDGYIIKPFDYGQLNYELFKIVEKIEKFSQNEEYKIHLKHMISQKTAELNSMIHFQKYNYDKTLLSMVEMIEDRDTYTAGHSERVAHYSKLIAEEMQYSKADCEKIHQAGILHDIGKIATPDVILLNPKKLNTLEYKLIQEHVEVGYKLLTNIPMFEELADIVHSHHEKYDGSGYPRGLNDDQITPLAKIMSVADAFDAMTTNRIYKGRKNIHEAIAELVSLEAIHYNPEVIDAAKVALKDIYLDENIDQFPHSDIEKERFSYFYNDILTNVYNQNYLDVVLVRNSFNIQFTNIYIFKLKNFSAYNKSHSWQSGDNLLKGIADILRKYSKKPEIFRVFGDDFVLLDSAQCELEKIKASILILLNKSGIECKFSICNVVEKKIHKVSNLEKFCK